MKVTADEYGRNDESVKGALNFREQSSVHQYARWHVRQVSLPGDPFDNPQTPAALRP